MSDISQIALNGVTYNVKDKTARTETDKKVSASGGDIANTKVSAFTTSADSYPVPAANDTVKVGFGKIKKFFEDFKSFKDSIVTKTMIINQILNDSTKAASAATVYSVNEKVDKANSDLATHIINNIYPDVGITEPFAQLLNMWGKLPEDAPFIGVYNNYGIRFYYGYIYSGRESGSIMLHDFSGRIIILSKVNGVFTKRYISTSIAE